MKARLAPLCALLVFLGGSLLPLPSHAQFVTVEGPGPLLAATLTEAAGTAPKNIADMLVWTTTKMAIQSITRSTVNWINSGFNGSPAFVTDLQQNLNVLSDTVANNFFQQLNTATIGATGFNLTSPFQDQITQQLRANYYKQTGNLLGLNQYDLSSKSSNPQAFLNNDFSQGGFNAFLSANRNPANNPFGAYQIASNALWNQIDAAAQQRKLEYQAGNGFLSWRGDCSQNDVVNSGIYDQATVDLVSAATPLSQTEACFGNPVKTPGSVIESQLENQLGSGVRQLELADSINEIVGALAGQLVNQVLGSGGLSGASQPASGGGSSYLNQATDPSQYTSGLTNGVTQTISNDIAKLTEYRSNWQKILDAANAAQQSCGASTQITSVIAQATAGVTKANTAIQQETAINKSIQSASASGDPTQVTTAITQYQSYLGAATTPSSSDESYAAAQSTDTGSATPSSLYTQMKKAQTTCPT